MWSSGNYLVAAIILLILTITAGSATTQVPTQTPYTYECGNPPTTCVGYTTSYTTEYTGTGLALLFLIFSIYCFVKYPSRKRQEKEEEASATAYDSSPSVEPATPQFAPPSPPAPPTERYCPSCGMGSARTATFCGGCGKPLPPPP
jgi:hypothetical protein